MQGVVPVIQINNPIYLELYGGQVEVEAEVSIKAESTSGICTYDNHETNEGIRVLVSLVRLANQVGHPVTRGTPLWRTAETALQKLLYHQRCACSRHYEALLGDVEHALEALHS